MLTATDLKQLPAFQTFTTEAIQAALDTIDQAAVVAEELAAVAVQVWDKQSDINGVPASYWLGREDVNPDGEVYLLNDTARDRLYFQPHVAGVEGFVWMSPEDVGAHAEAHREAVAQENARARILGEVQAALARQENK
jgi:hypothetical protein